MQNQNIQPVIPGQQVPAQQPVPEVIQQIPQQQPMGQVPGQVPSTPIPSTTPELEQILVKLQELEQRLGEQEMQNANQTVGQNEGKFERLRSRREEITGEPEIDKNRKPNKTIGPEGTSKIPKAQTSEIGEDGAKTGAPVAGEETGLDKGKPFEDEATSLVPKPKKELPKLPIIKNALDQADGGVPVPGKPSNKPKEMEDENGNKVPKSQSPDGFEEHYNYIKQKLSGRKSTIGAFGGSKMESLTSAKNDANMVINEYLQKSKIRI